jgi:uncharacterized protein YgbK (DUF1537 family)
MIQLDCLLIADDLTGACDAAVQFARRGRAASVMLAMDAPPAAAPVMAISTGSRHLAEEQLPAVMDALPTCPARILFKKIDSVLRGNPGAEIAAAMQALGCDAAVATPAFPALGRVVDARNAAEVARRLRSDVHVAADGVAKALAAGARVVSADAACDADLDCIVSGAMASRRRILWAGSGGLAAALARRLGGPPLAYARGSGPSHDRKGVVFCIGSDHPVTVQQVANLRAQRPESVILPLGPIPDAGALVLSGGETASAVCRAAGARRIDLCDEILPGIPWGFLRCGRFDGVPVVTKSGGFGAPDALIRVAEFFQ